MAVNSPVPSAERPPLKDRLLRLALQLGASACLFGALIFVEEERPRAAMMCGAVLWSLAEVWRWRFGGPASPTRRWAERVVGGLAGNP